MSGDSSIRPMADFVCSLLSDVSRQTWLTLALAQNQVDYIDNIAVNNLMRKAIGLDDDYSVDSSLMLL